jgi:acetyl-CoA carboxylase biotin carboxyl carrier protein
MAGDFGSFRVAGLDFWIGSKPGTPNAALIKEDNLATPVTAPMVGKILRVEKKVGDVVEEDEVVIVMEAMKMEIPVVAPASGTVKEIKVSAGQAVEAEDTLAEIE